MLLHSSDGSEFELRILGYKSAANVTDYQELNWLMVGVRVEVPKGAWHAVYPCMLAWEAQGLAKWLQDVSEGTPAKREISFSMRDLRFQFIKSDSQMHTIRIFFEYAYRPPWSPPSWGDVSDCWVDMFVSRQELSKAAQMFHNETSQYPPRTPEKSKGLLSRVASWFSGEDKQSGFSTGESGTD